MPQIFTMKEKQELRQKMLETGFSLLKEHGMTHTSVDKVTKAAGLGRTTFYNFFLSKEQFVHEIICYQREKGQREFQRILDGREKMTAAEAKNYLKYLFKSQDSVYNYLTPEDEQKLKAALPEEYTADISSETAELDSLLVHMEGVKENVDYEVAANLMKVLALTKESSDLLHADALDRTLDALFDLLFTHLFVKGEDHEQ